MAGTDSKYKDSFISQDDLDRLLKEADSLSLEAFAGPGQETDFSPVEDDAISQDDIDALLSLADKDSVTAAQDSDVISQDDIDALLAGNIAPAPQPDDDIDDEPADLDLVTPEDIEKLLRSEPVEQNISALESSDLSGGDLDTITQEDLRSLTESNEIKAESGLDQDDDDSLISQEDINALLSGAGNVDTQSNEPQNAEETILPVLDENEEDSLISQEDIDSLLAGAGLEDDKAVIAQQEEETNLISQEDIDKLLLGTNEEAEETLIDQEDIDRLLSSSSPFDGQSMDEFSGQDKLISQEDIDRLLNEDLSEAEITDDRPMDQVILEEPPAKTKPGRDKKNTTSVWYRSRLFVSMAAATMVVLVSLIALMIMSGKSEKPLAQNDTADTIEALDNQATRPDPLPVEIPPSRIPDIITVTMNEFIVPAPAKIKGLSYITLSLTLEIADAPVNPIKDYEPFFRNIVYEVLNKAFILQSDSKIVETDLKKMIKDALNDALSEGSISKVDFSDFKVG
ncbi:MAG: hypothetical protein KKD44_01390 [Proteobacteria bacterium]|nr:hypothetical protein [Pseudomonadota bacterium]